MILMIEIDNQPIITSENRRYSTHSLPMESKALVHLALFKLKRTKDAQKVNFLRRFIYALLSGGVVVDLIDELGLEASGRRITSANFERIALNWNESANFHYAAAHFDLARAVFANICSDPSRPIHADSLGFLFWGGALNTVFLQEHPTFSLYSTIEFKTKVALIGSTECKADYALMLDHFPPSPNETSRLYPILLSDFGAEAVKSPEQHKGFDKMTCMLSASCYRLIEKLIELRRDPNLARVYGLLIGGTKAHVLIAHPSILQAGRQKEIKVRISADPEWKIDLIKSESVASQAQRRTRARQPVNPQESIVAPEEVIDWSSINLEAFQPSTATINQTTEAAEKKSSESGRDLEESAFAKLSYFGKLVTDSMTKICATDQAGHDTSIDQICKPGKIPIAKSADESESTKSFQYSRPRMNVIKPLKQAELFINEHAGSCFPAFFPRIYDIQLQEDEGKVCYEMELLEQLIICEYALSSQLSQVDSNEESLFRFSKLLLDCLFQLLLLHKRLGFIHSDISPWNLMYSPIDGLWKLIDFGQSKTLADSAATERVAGTEDFVAPECLPHGRFSEASDVWSLGRVLEVILPPELSFGLGEKSLEAYDNLLSLYTNMKHDSPECHPTVIQAIEQALSIVLAFPSFVNVADPVIQGARTLTRSVFKTRFQKVENA